MAGIRKARLRDGVILRIVSTLALLIYFANIAIYLRIEAEFNDCPRDLSYVVWCKLQLAIQTDINGEFSQTTTGKPTSRGFTGLRSF